MVTITIHIGYNLKGYIQWSTTLSFVEVLDKYDKFRMYFACHETHFRLGI